MPQVVLVKKRPIKPAAIGAVVLAGLALVGIIGGLLYSNWLSQAETRYTTAVHVADGQMQLLHYDQAIVTYQDYLATRPTKDRTYRVQIYLAEAYQQQGTYDQAIVWYQKAEANGTAWDLIAKPGIAQSAQLAGQKDLSIRYYKQSIDLIKKTNSPSKAQTLREYEAGITSQGGSVD